MKTLSYTKLNEKELPPFDILCAGFHSPLMLRKTIIIVTLAQIIRAVFVIYVDYIMMY